jgi:hypothetical protein
MHLPSHRAGHDPSFPLSEQDAETFNAKPLTSPADEIAAPASGVCSSTRRPKGLSRISKAKMRSAKLDFCFKSYVQGSIQML